MREAIPHRSAPAGHRQDQNPHSHPEFLVEVFLRSIRARATTQDRPCRAEKILLRRLQVLLEALVRRLWHRYLPRLMILRAARFAVLPGAAAFFAIALGNGAAAFAGAAAALGAACAA
jgi:hypothetical protein